MRVNILLTIGLINFFSIYLSQEVVDESAQTHSDENAHVQESIDDEISNNFSAEWERRMGDYDPGYVYMIPVKPRKSETYFEDIEKVPVRIRGAFITDENIKDKIEFVITSPLNKLVYKNYTNECIFEIEITEPGPYKIKFKNSQSKHELKVTFTMNTYQHVILKKDHLNTTEERIDRLASFMNKIKLEESLVSKKKQERKKSMILI